MSPLEFAYWRDRSNHEPFGYDIDNYRMGAIAAAVVNVTKTRKADMVTPAHFYPNKSKRKPKLTRRQREQQERKKHGKRRNSNS